MGLTKAFYAGCTTIPCTIHDLRDLPTRTRLRKDSGQHNAASAAVFVVVGLIEEDGLIIVAD